MTRCTDVSRTPWPGFGPSRPRRGRPGSCGRRVFSRLAPGCISWKSWNRPHHDHVTGWNDERTSLGWIWSWSQIGVERLPDHGRRRHAVPGAVPSPGRARALGDPRGRRAGHHAAGAGPDAIVPAPCASRRHPRKDPVSGRAGDGPADGVVGGGLPPGHRWRGVTLARALLLADAGAGRLRPAFVVGAGRRAAVGSRVDACASGAPWRHLAGAGLPRAVPGALRGHRPARAHRGDRAGPAGRAPAADPEGPAGPGGAA